MRILTVRLPDELVAEIEAESHERQRSKSDVVRERLSRPVYGRPRAFESSGRPVRAAALTIASDPRCAGPHIRCG